MLAIVGRNETEALLSIDVIFDCDQCFVGLSLRC
jgi:hypothetical protein